MKITLDDVAPPVSRTIEVPLVFRLDRLHAVFQAALAWTDSHLWEMTFERTGFGVLDPEYGFDGPIDARKATLAQALRDTWRKTIPAPLRLRRRLGAQRKDRAGRADRSSTDLSPDPEGDRRAPAR